MKENKNVTACSLCNGNCMGCFYCDECDIWLDNGGDYIPTVTVDTDTASMALCEGRHAIPDATDGAIFETEIADPTDTCTLEEVAFRKLEGLKSLNLYVTGLTVALIAVLNVCRRENIIVTLWHFNRDTGKYFAQTVA